MSLVATSKPNNAAFDVSANQWNNLVAKMNSLLYVQVFDVTIPMDDDHAHLTHNIGETPMAIVLAPVDDVGRCWYDMNTVTANAVDIYVANPPQDGGYLIRVVIYYMES